MRVAILTFYSFEEVAGGTEIFVRYLKRAFPESDLITYSIAKKHKMKADLSKVNLEEAKMGFVTGRKFHENNRKDPYDLVLSNSTAGWFISLLRPGIPMINVYHFTFAGMADKVLRGTPGYSASRYFIPLFERASAFGKVNVAVSYKTQRELKEYYGQESRVIENGVPLDVFKPVPRDEAREILGLDWDGPMGIFVGRTDHTKGFDIVQRVSRMKPDTKILCITPSRVLDDRLILRRNVRNEEMPLYYSASDFFLFPSRYESASYSALEAMACDLPVVVSRTGIFEDIDEVRVGRIVDSFKPEDFAKAIDFILASTGYDSRRLVSERFSLEKFLDGYRRLADELVPR
ncbi:MAG: glycosyltransferase family 4 protein [Methanomassiliicoccales archaeon]|nr:glycosyltransferase family 4 protein [Methanomassiliicoccales archaeon]